MLTKEKKSEIVRKFAKGASDTGSTSVQVALLTERIGGLTNHLKSAKKDYASHRGLLGLVSQRRRLLTYLKKSNIDAYGKILKALELRK